MTAGKINFALLFGFVISTGILGVVAAQDDKDKDQGKEIAWFDMERCEVCKNFAPMKDTMHRIKWENHMLDNGMISVSVVPEDMKADMAKAQANIQSTVARLTQGEQLDMCGHCQFMGKMMQMGAKFKQLQTVGVDITLVTSSDAEVVKEIQTFAKKSQVEHEKMLKKINMR